MKLLFLLLTLFPFFAQSKCDVYYFSLDFGGAMGDGAQIVDYLGHEDVPFTLFLVGKNSATENGKKVCEKIRSSLNPNISIGNHTVSHEGFSSSHTEGHIRNEILGNESYMGQCDSKRVIKYFRYPKGAPHPLAEKVLKESGYLGTYEEFFPQADATPSKAVWWTTDTRDWVKATGASAWAQIDYFNRNGKLLTVDQDSWKDLLSTLKKSAPTEVFNQKLQEHLAANGETYPGFDPMENIRGLHGPDANEIASKVIRDEGKLGKDGKRHCFPLMHYGGINTFTAFKKIIPELKNSGAEFKALGGGMALEHQLTEAIKTLDTVTKVEIQCQKLTPESFTYKVVAGDNLFGIARAMINTNRTVCAATEKSPVSKLAAKIMTLNKLTATSEINPETKLVIPTSCL